MNNLLHSLRGFKTAVPFTFDESNMGFDQGKWVEVKNPTSTQIENLSPQTTMSEPLNDSELGDLDGDNTQTSTYGNAASFNKRT